MWILDKVLGAFPDSLIFYFFACGDVFYYGKPLASKRRGFAGVGGERAGVLLWWDLICEIGGSMKENLYIKGNLHKAMLTFVVPYLLGMVLQNLYGAVDLFVVGQFATTADVSAVTIGSQLMSMATQLIIGLATGVTVLIGQQFGAGNQKALSRTVANAIAFFSSIAVGITVVYLICVKPFSVMLKTPEAALPATQQYIFICSFGISFSVGYNVISSFWMGLGNTKTPFLFIASACVVNIVLDVVLVKGFRMGAAGAAVATSIAQAVSFLLSLLYLRVKGLGFALERKEMKVQRQVIGNIVKIGTPIAVQNVLVGISFLFITAIINQIGLAASAAAGVVEKLFGFFIMPAVAFSSAVSTISAQNMGAGNLPRAKKSLISGIWMSLIPSVIIVVLCQISAQWFTPLFTNDTEVIALAASYLRSYVTDCIVVCFVFCLNGYFNGTGYSWFTMVHSLLTSFLFRIPLSYLFGQMADTSLYLIGWAAPISTCVSLVMCLLFYRHLQKKGKKKLQAKAEA